MALDMPYTRRVRRACTVCIEGDLSTISKTVVHGIAVVKS